MYPIPFATVLRSSVIAVLLATVMPGCVTHSSPGPTRVTDDICPPALLSACSLNAGVLRIEGATLTAQGDASPALLIQMRSRDVVVDNANLVGGFGLVVDFQGCSTCRLTISDSEIVARWHGISVVGGAGTLSIHNTTVTTHGGGAYQEEVYPDGKTEIEIGGTYGIALPPESKLTVVLRNVTFAARDPSVGHAIGGLNVTVAAVQAQGVTISGYRVGMAFEASEVTLRDISIVCDQDGLAAMGRSGGATTAVFESIDVSGCSRSAFQVHGFDAATLQNVTIRGGHIGIQSDVTNMTIRQFNVATTNYGVLLRPRGAGTLVAEDGTIVNSTFSGLYADHASMLIRNVAFLRNGHGWPDPDGVPATMPFYYGGLSVRANVNNPQIVLDPPVVRNCTFEGNVPYGMSYSGYQADATQNWWGSTDGPSVDHGASPVPPVGGSGDAVSVTVRYAPFLTAPP